MKCENCGADGAELENIAFGKSDDTSVVALCKQCLEDVIKYGDFQSGKLSKKECLEIVLDKNGVFCRLIDYRCPHCGLLISVAESGFDEMMKYDCPKCKMPLKKGD